MRMRVPHPGRQSRMDVGVVAVVMPVAMRVRHRLVRMLVFVAGGEHHVQAGRDARSSRELRNVDALAEDGPREDHPEKRRVSLAKNLHFTHLP